MLSDAVLRFQALKDELERRRLERLRLETRLEQLKEELASYKQRLVSQGVDPTNLDEAIQEAEERLDTALKELEEKLGVRETTAA